METQPGKRLPKDYALYPGKMDHTTCVIFKVGAADFQNPISQKFVFFCANFLLYYIFLLIFILDSNNLLLKKGLNCWIQLLVDVLNEDGIAHSDSHLEHLEVVSISELQYLEAPLLFHALEPLVGLDLWIDKQRPSLSFVVDDGVFDTERVIWQTRQSPVSDVHSVSKNSLQAEFSGVGNFFLLTELNPFF